MKTTTQLLLAGTILPALVLAQPQRVAATEASSALLLRLAQADLAPGERREPGEEPRGERRHEPPPGARPERPEPRGQPKGAEPKGQERPQAPRPERPEPHAPQPQLQERQPERPAPAPQPHREPSQERPTTAPPAPVPAPPPATPPRAVPAPAPAAPPPAAQPHAPEQRERTNRESLPPAPTPPQGQRTPATAPPPAPAPARPAERGTRLETGPQPGGFTPNVEGRRLDDVRSQRREAVEDGRTVIREPGRIIVREGGNTFIRHDEVERFRDLGTVRTERRGRDTVTIIDRPRGEQILTIVDEDGRLLRRVRRFPDGREVVIIDNTFRGPPRRIEEDVVVLPEPEIRIPRDRYIVEAEGASEETIYETLIAPPVAPIERRYTLDEVRYSPTVRARMRSVDVDTINFDTGSWEVTPDQAPRLAGIARAINQAVSRNPAEVFLIEGHTDAVGPDIDNLSLSDRRAQSAAAILTRDFQVPPENLTTQGYGEQYLKVNTQAPARENRRVTVRRITPLLNGQAQAR